MIEKVLIITSEPFPGGMAGTNRIISLGKGFIENGLKAEILCISQYEVPQNPAEGVYEGLPYRSLFKSANKGNFFSRVTDEFIKPLLLVYQTSRRINNDTLIIYYSSETIPAILIKGVKILKGGIFIKDETEHPSVRIAGKNSLAEFLFMQVHYSAFDGLFVITRNLFEHFRNELNYAKYLEVLPMIIDVERFNIQGQNPKPQDRTHTIVFSGVLDAKKEGIDILIKAFAKVREKHYKYSLDLYGEVDDGQKQKFINLINELNLTRWVNIRGYRTREQMTRILMDADILVFTRPESLQATYGFSTKLGEYLATGKPVVATSVGEISNYLKDQVNAFVCRPDEDSIAQKICAVIDNYSFAQECGAEGKRSVLRFFNNKIETQRIIDTVRNYQYENSTGGHK